MFDELFRKLSEGYRAFVREIQESLKTMEREEAAIRVMDESARPHDCSDDLKGLR